MVRIKNTKVILPYVMDVVELVWYIFAIRCRQRNLIQKYLEEGIGTNIRYPIQMHLQKCYESLGYEKGGLSYCPGDW